jgi:pyruvate kinase
MPISKTSSDSTHLTNPRKTKIVATIGPSSRSPERVLELIKAGVNVFRLNFSHGSHEEHLIHLQTIREASNALRMPIAVLQDLSGPKIRITNISGDYVTIPDDGTVMLHAGKEFSDEKNIYIEGLDASKFAQKDQSVLLADGIISLNIESVKGDVVTCSVIKGGRLRSRVGIAFPDSVIDLPATTDKDIKDLHWGIKHGIDYVAISFVQNAKDIQMVRSEIKTHESDIKIIAKIERKTALENIDEIVKESDGLMVARGDLGLELPLEKVPRVQKELIEKANYKGIPVIVATQMLHSMITSVRPTRAEVSDISAAVMSGADAVMLSEETAIGENPVEAVVYLSKIAREAEKAFEFEEYKPRLHDADRQTVPDSIAYAACAAAVKVNAAAIISCTETGTSGRLVAKYRPQQLHFSVSPKEFTLRKLSLNWGVRPLLVDQTTTSKDEIEGAIKAVSTLLQLPKGSRIVIIGGAAVRTPGGTNILEVREVV